jgi:hypothetical protein
VSGDLAPARVERTARGSRRDFFLGLDRLAQHVAAAPDGFDVVAVRGMGELPAQLAHENVDDLHFRLVYTAVEVVEEHLLGQRHALAQREQLQHLIFLAGQMHARAVDLDRLGVEVDDEITSLDEGLSMALGAPHDGVDARDQLVPVERLGLVVGAEAEPPDLVLDAGKARQYQDRRLHLRDAQTAQHLEAGHIRKVKIEEDDVVVVDLAEIDPFLAEIGGLG